MATILFNEYLNNEYDETTLILNFENTSFEIVNAIRKASINQIPIYAFHPLKIKITKNTSIFDDTYMKCRLPNLSIRNIKTEINNLENEYIQDINYSEINYLKHPLDTMNIEYFISVKNKDNLDILYVTENDIVKKINGETIQEYIENPVTIIQLKHGQEFECSLKAVLNIGETNAIFNASHCWYKTQDNKNFMFFIESHGQMHEFDIIKKGCLVINEKLLLIKQNIESNKNVISFDNNKSIILEVDNEDLTTFGPIKYFLLQSPNVLFAGTSRYNGYLVKNVCLKVKTTENTTPFDEINKSIELCINYFLDIHDQIENLQNSKNNKKEIKETKKETKKTKSKK
jgi:DNA-directed RNA polymerase subunit L